MKSCALLLFVFAFVGAAFAQQTTDAANVPEIRFRSVPDFLKLPADLYLGEASGVAVNSKGHVFVFSRGNTTGSAYGAAAAQLLEFGADGHFIRVASQDYPPLLQGAVVIRGAAGAAAAHRFLQFLQSPDVARSLADRGLEPAQRLAR